MTRILLFLVFMLAGTVQLAQAQSKSPVIKVHAFKREVVPGAKPDGPQEKNYKYYIYIESQPGTSFSVKEVWMDWKKWDFTTAARKSPVKMENPVVYADQQKNIAVPATKNKITEVIMNGEIEGKTPGKDIASQLSQNAALVRLSYKSKIINIYIKEFKERDAMFLQ
jgi:hypothetical protein